MVNRQELPLWGIKGNDKISRYLVRVVNKIFLQFFNGGVNRREGEGG